MDSKILKHVSTQAMREWGLLETEARSSRLCEDTLKAIAQHEEATGGPVSFPNLVLLSSQWPSAAAPVHALRKVLKDLTDEGYLTVQSPSGKHSELAEYQMTEKGRVYLKEGLSGEPKRSESPTRLTLVNGTPRVGHGR